MEIGKVDVIVKLKVKKALVKSETFFCWKYVCRSNCKIKSKQGGIITTKRMRNLLTLKLFFVGSTIVEKSVKYKMY